ncbi:glycosyltransferase [Thiobacillus sp.]
MNAFDKNQQGAMDKAPAPGAYYQHARPEILERVPLTARKVLDVGCGAGGLSANLKIRQAVEVHGVELVEQAAVHARTHMDKVWNCSIEDALDEIPNNYYECIVVADVLEHLIDPWSVLNALKGKLTADGKIVASVPNIQNWGVLADLIQGKWNYQNEGILDRTHLRFFTRKTLEELFWSSGLHIMSLSPKNGGALPPVSLIKNLNKLGLDAEKLAQDGQVFQFLIEADIPPVSDAPKIAIVVLNWNGKEDTLECLTSIGKLDYPNYEVIVVDNGSTDDSVDAIRTKFPKFSVLETRKNLGYAGGNNVGIRQALEQGAEFILVLNNDTVVSPQLLDKLVSAAAQHPDAGFLGPRLLYYDRPEKVWFDGANWNTSINYFRYPGQNAHASSLSLTDHETDYVCGAALFVRATTARQIGLMDERYFLVWEEVDWCYRAREAGWRSIVVPQATLLHKVGVSFGGEDSPLRTYFAIRNELLWCGRHAGTRGWLRSLGKRLSQTFPSFAISGNKAHPLPKRIWWAASGWLSAVQHPQQRATRWATRRAILDYLFKRLGDCPERVRLISRQWRKDCLQSGTESS